MAKNHISPYSTNESSSTIPQRDESKRNVSLSRFLEVICYIITVSNNEADYLPVYDNFISFLV